MKIFYRKRETKNLGNYENVSVEIGAEDEVNFEIETSEDCYIRLKRFIDEKLKTELEPTSIDIDSVKKEITNLITISTENRKRIKNLLAKFGANKVTQLSFDNLKAFNQQLKLLGGKNE
jgi:hypothetical protein